MFSEAQITGTKGEGWEVVHIVLITMMLPVLSTKLEGCEKCGGGVGRVYVVIPAA